MHVYICIYTIILIMINMSILLILVIAIVIAIVIERISTMVYHTTLWINKLDFVLRA